MATSIDDTPSVLLVDDRPENLLALEAVLEPLNVRLRTAGSGEEALKALLEREQMQVSFAENGRDGIEVLERDPTIEIVLMDIMMPEMDGYDTMRAIRRIPKFKSLPIITLTAKAMKGDRDKCIAAGASDYITKPVDIDQLTALMRVWLHSA